MKSPSKALFVVTILSFISAAAFGQSFEQMSRQPNAYKGQNVWLQGKVIQAVQKGLDFVFRVSVSSNNRDVVYVEYRAKSDSEPRFIEGDEVRFRGKFIGLK